jgi:hypothetical protein
VLGEDNSMTARERVDFLTYSFKTHIEGHPLYFVLVCGLKEFGRRSRGLIFALGFA